MTGSSDANAKKATNLTLPYTLTSKTNIEINWRNIKKDQKDQNNLKLIRVALKNTEQDQPRLMNKESY